MSHSRGSEVPCYFCPFGYARKDVLAKHGARKHPSAVDIAGTRTPSGYLFHLLDGHTDRVWATVREKESPTSIGYCFACHSHIEKDCYKKIEDAVAAHVCREKKERAKRMPTVTAAAGGAGTTPPGPFVVINEEYLQKAYKEHGKSFEYPYNDDCTINVKEAVERVFREAFRVEGILKNNRQLAADLTKARSTAPSTGGAADPDLILTMLKSDGALRAFVSQQETIKQGAAADPIVLDDDDEADVTPYNPFDVIKQMAYDAKRLAVVRKQLEQTKTEKADAVIALEGQLAQMSQQVFRLQQENMGYQKDLSATERSLMEHQVEVKRLREENERLTWKVKVAEGATTE